MNEKKIQEWTRVVVYGMTQSQYEALTAQQRTEMQQAEVNHLLSTPEAMKAFKAAGYSL